jgi:predicted phosphoribosyltransferase
LPAWDAELDVFEVRKLGVPNWSGLAMGALAGGGIVVINEFERLRAEPAGGRAGGNAPRQQAKSGRPATAVNKL